MTAVTWCSHCGAPVDAGRCTDRTCALSRKVGAPAEYAARVRELDRLAKSALLDIMARHAREAGARWLIGGPALWSKDELINGVLAFEYPPPPPAVPADVLTGTQQANLPAGCNCGYALSHADGRWHLISRERCPLHRTVPNDTYGDLTAAELADLRAAAHPCLACGMLADVDPELHLSRYGHRPKYRDDSGRVLAWFAGRWAEKIDESADPEPAATPAKRRPRLATNATPGYPIGRLQRAEPEPKEDGP